VVFWGIPLLVGTAALCLVYLHLLNTCECIGREIKALELEQTKLRKQLANEERNWSVASSIPNLEALMERHGVVMSFPEPGRVIHMTAQRDPREPAQYAGLGGAMRRD